MEQANFEPLAVSVSAATHLAGLGRTSIYEAIGAGDLASCKVGSRRLIMVEDLRAWLARQRRTTKRSEQAAAPPPPARQARCARAEVGR